MTDLERAIAFATEAHAGQVDKRGEPYILHPLRVMLAVPRGAEPVAVLHDVVEDTGYSLGAVAYYTGLSPAEVLALDALTRRPGETYADYIDRAASVGHGGDTLALRAEWIVRQVKPADLRDHLGRWVPELGEDLERRYERALARLTKGETT